MKLIFALGNPGSEYVGTRHNTGFMAADSLAFSHGAKFAEKPKLYAYIAEFSVDGEKILIAKPTTFYNQVGKSAHAIVSFYKLTPGSDLLAIHDDLALPFGSIRVRKKGSDAGNKGIRSLNVHLGEDYTRLRTGIAVDDRTSDDASFVLSRFNSSQATALKEAIIPKLRELANDFIAGTLEDTSFTMRS